MLRFVLGISLTLTCSAASVTTYYSQSAFEDAIGSGSFTTESFSGNQINTPGLTVTGCTSSSVLPPYVQPCNQLSNSQLRSPNQLEYITQNMFTDAVGRSRANPYDGDTAAESSTFFTLPKSVTAIGFDINETTDTQGANFGIGLGTTNEFTLYPFGGVEGPNDPFPGLPNNGYSYDGFIGFTSDTPFNTIAFDAIYGLGTAYTLDNLEFGDPVPEPRTSSFIGLGTLLFGVGLRKAISRPR